MANFQNINVYFEPQKYPNPKILIATGISTTAFFSTPHRTECHQKRKAPVEGTRRSTRSVSQGKMSTTTENAPPAKKRAIEKVAERDEKETLQGKTIHQC